MKALIVLSALKRKCGCNCARRLCSCDSTSRAFQLGRPKRQLVRLVRAALHLLRILPRERDAGDHGVDRQVGVEPIEIEVAEVVRQGSAKES